MAVCWPSRYTVDEATATLDRVLKMLAGPTTVARATGKPTPSSNSSSTVAGASSSRRPDGGNRPCTGRRPPPTALAGHGPTLVVSPLLALMRDQIDAAARAGVVAASINSTNHDDWDEVYAQMRADTLDVILISPERLASPSFTAQLDQLTVPRRSARHRRSALRLRLGTRLPPRLPADRRGAARHPDVPVLATTATANARVTADVADQLGDATRRDPRQPRPVVVAARLVPGLNAAQRWAWVTRRSRMIARVRDRLRAHRRRRRAAGRLPRRRRPRRRRLHRSARRRGARRRRTAAAGQRRSRPSSPPPRSAWATTRATWRSASTSASPSSPVAMYQQVGRAGRAIDDAVAVLLPAETDERLWEYFATVGIPDPELATADARPARPRTGLGAGARAGDRRTARADRGVAARAVGRRRGTRPGAAGRRLVDRGRSTPRSTRRCAPRREIEAELMRRYARKQPCLMKQLQETLDDPDPPPCGRCGVCTVTVVAAADPRRRPVDAARQWMRSTTNRIEPRKMWPTGGATQRPDHRRRRGAHGRLRRRSGLARCRGRGPHRSRRTGQPRGRVHVLGHWRHDWPARPTCVVALPVPTVDVRCRARRSDRHSRQASGRRGVTWRGGPATSDGSSGARVAQLARRLTVADGAAVSGTVLLVAGTYRSGWTTTAAAALLRDAGAARVLPLVAHQWP